MYWTDPFPELLHLFGGQPSLYPLLFLPGLFKLLLLTACFLTNLDIGLYLLFQGKLCVYW